MNHVRDAGAGEGILYMRAIYPNTSVNKTMHGAVSFTKIDKNSDASLNFKYYVDTSTLGDVVANFVRGNHTNKILKLVDSELDVTVTKY